MNFNDAKKEIKKLKINLKKWSEKYYEKNNSIIDDSLYDEQLKELFEIEKKFPELITKDSPTQTVGSLSLSIFKKINHLIPMLSLKNAFNNEDLKHFDKQINQIKKTSYYVEPKVDGLSISIIYKNGELFKGITRGDGTIGEDVTKNILQIKNLPKKINLKNNIEIRGEIYMPLFKFKEINNKRIQNELEPFANPRNAASGTMRQLDVEKVSQRGLELIVYWAFNLEKNNYQWSKQSETINELNNLGFLTSKISKELPNINEVINEIDYISSLRKKLEYEIDGIVIKVNDTKIYNRIGSTSKFPKWSIAYKFPTEIKETILEEIFPTIGRTGRVTYNAKLKPVHISGTIVQRATLHNAEYIKDLDLRINDIVRIKKAGEIIPKIISVNKNKRSNNTKKWEENKYCPSCHSKLVRIKNEIDQYCLNDLCHLRLIESIIHFASRDAMNIEGLSSKQIEKFVNIGWIKDISDIYKLKEKKEEMILLEGYQKKSINSLLKSIDATKNNSLDKLLFGLGIRYIGKKTSKDLATKFSSFENIINSTIENLLLQDDFGEVKSQSIIDFFKSKKNIDLLKNLNKLGVKPNKEETIINSNNNKFYNKKIVITGKIKGGTREEINNIFLKLGAKIVSSVSSSTNYVIAGEKPSQLKIEKINAKNIIHITNINDINNIKK